MATRPSTLAWKTPWTEEPGGLQSMGSLGVGHDWATSLSLSTFMHWRRTWQAPAVFLPGESPGPGTWWAALCGVARGRLKRLSSSGGGSALSLGWSATHRLLVFCPALHSHSHCVCWHSLASSQASSACLKQTLSKYWVEWIGNKWIDWQERWCQFPSLYSTLNGRSWPLCSFQTGTKKLYFFFFLGSMTHFREGGLHS